MIGGLTLLVAPLLALLLGALLAILGFRGKRLDDHPLCRACGFDLVGVAPEAARDDGLPSRCPECGRAFSLTKPRSIRRGNRRVRRPLLATGLALLLIGLVAGASLGFMVLAGRSVNLYAVLPTSTLMDMAMAPSPRAIAVDELARRFSADTLTRAQIDALVARGLAVQADDKLPWLRQWGRIIEAANTRSMLSDAQRMAYFKNAIRPEFHYRPVVRAGKTFALGPYFPNCRVDNPSFSLAMNMKPEGVWLGDTQLPMNGGEHSIYLYPKELGAAYEAVGSFTAAVPPGEYPLRTVYRFDAPVGSAAAEPPPGEISPTSWTLEFTGKVVVKAPGEPIIRTIDDPAMGREILSSLSLSPLCTQVIGGQTFSAGALDFDHPRMSCAFQIIWRTPDGREFPIQRACCESKVRSGGGLMNNLPNPFSADKVDLILRTTDPDIALNRLDITEIWSGQIVIPNIPLLPPTTPTGPGAATVLTPIDPSKARVESLPKP